MPSTALDPGHAIMSKINPISACKHLTNGATNYIGKATKGIGCDKLREN